MRTTCNLAAGDHRHSYRAHAKSYRAFVLLLGMTAAQAFAQAGSGTPCLQQLNEQKANPAKAESQAPSAPGWFSQNAGKVLGAVGAVTGGVLGNTLCKKSAYRNECIAGGAIGGALLGSELGKMLSEADKKRYQEATYKVALTGRPQSLTLDTGCMVVEPTSNETFEQREIEMAFGSGVATPRNLRAVATPYIRSSSTNVAGNPGTTQGLTKVAANVPSFVMGSTDSGRYLLLGREDSEQGFVGAGYVDAQGWTASPDSAPASIALSGGQPRLAKVGVEVPCRQIASSIRVQASNKMETFPGKVCVMPNGITDSQ